MTSYLYDFAGPRSGTRISGKPVSELKEGELIGLVEPEIIYDSLLDRITHTLKQFCRWVRR